MAKREQLNGMDLQIFSRFIQGKVTQRQIAQDLGISEVTVSSVVNSERFRLAQADVIDYTEKTLANSINAQAAISLAKGAAPRLMAANIYIAEHGRTEAIKLKAIHDILDRAVGRSTQKIVHSEEDAFLDDLSEAETLKFAETGEVPERHKNVGRVPGTVH